VEAAGVRVAELRFLVRAFDAVIMLANRRLNDVLFWTAGSPLGWFSDALEPVTKPQLAPVWMLRSGPLTKQKQRALETHIGFKTTVQKLIARSHVRRT